jgi:hypothetical protein
MTILFSPSEAKSLLNTDRFKISNLPFQESLLTLREDILEKYKKIVSGDKKNLSIHTGLNKSDELDQLSSAPLDQGICALYRYTGVAFKYLDADSLENKELDFLYKNLLIFSNLFGPIYGGDIIPYYKLKQGQSLNGFKVENAYKPILNPLLDEKLNNSFVLDLRAGFYEKFYTPKIPYCTMQFFKEGKKISHWAKAYRGKVVRTLAIYRPSTQSEFEDISFEGLQIKEILRQKNATHYFFDISDAL